MKQDRETTVSVWAENCGIQMDSYEAELMAAFIECDDRPEVMRHQLECNGLSLRRHMWQLLSMVFDKEVVAFRDGKRVKEVRSLTGLDLVQLVSASDFKGISAGIDYLRHQAQKKYGYGDWVHYMNESEWAWLYFYGSTPFNQAECERRFPEAVAEHRESDSKCNARYLSRVISSAMEVEHA